MILVFEGRLFAKCFKQGSIYIYIFISIPLPVTIETSKCWRSSISGPKMSKLGDAADGSTEEVSVEEEESSTRLGVREGVSASSH